jgi:hypothetical protein
VHEYKQAKQVRQMSKNQVDAEQPRVYRNDNSLAAVISNTVHALQCTCASYLIVRELALRPLRLCGCCVLTSAGVWSGRKRCPSKRKRTDSRSAPTFLQ